MEIVNGKVKVYDRKYVRKSDNQTVHTVIKQITLKKDAPFTDGEIVNIVKSSELENTLSNNSGDAEKEKIISDLKLEVRKSNDVINDLKDEIIQLQNNHKNETEKLNDEIKTITDKLNDTNLLNTAILKDKDLVNQQLIQYYDATSTAYDNVADEVISAANDEVQNISFMDLVFHKKNIKLEIPKNTIIKKNRVKIPSNHLITSGDE